MLAGIPYGKGKDAPRQHFSSTPTGAAPAAPGALQWYGPWLSAILSPPGQFEGTVHEAG